MDRETPSGREVSYRLAVNKFVVRQISDSDIEIEYPAYTLVEVEDESVGMREFVTSSSGRLRELAPGQHEELDRTRGWRTFADGVNGRTRLGWPAMVLVAALLFVVLVVWKRRT
jgi:hypothetical protein